MAHGQQRLPAWHGERHWTKRGSSSPSGAFIARGASAMSDNPVPAIGVVEEHGSFLLIRAGSRFAVVEKRAGQLYPMKPGDREAKSMSAEGMASVIAEEG